jgi:hypothetical protein
MHIPEQSLRVLFPRQLSDRIADSRAVRSTESALDALFIGAAVNEGCKNPCWYCGANEFVPGVLIASAMPLLCPASN